MFYLKKQRLKKGLKQRDLAQLLHRTKATISRWENGLRQVPAKEVENLAQALGLKPEVIRPDVFRSKRKTAA